MSQVIAIDGRICEPGAAVISVLDRGFLYGDGIFTVLRGRGGRAVDLEGHLEQLAADAAQLGLSLPSDDELVGGAGRVLEELGAARARLRLVISRGAGRLGARWSELGSRVVMIGEEETGAARTEVRAVVVEEPRLVASATFAPKSLSYQGSLLARERAAEAGADEALRLFPDDTVGEGAACNVFAVLAAGAGGGPLVVTPPARGIRPGVTRRRVLELCAGEAGVGVSERPIPRGELAAAGELFVTSSIAGVVPITSLDGRARAAGPVTAELRRRYEQLVER